MATILLYENVLEFFDEWTDEQVATFIRTLRKAKDGEEYELPEDIQVSTLLRVLLNMPKKKGGAPKGNKNAAGRKKVVNQYGEAEAAAARNNQEQLGTTPFKDNTNVLSNIKDNTEVLSNEKEKEKEIINKEKNEFTYPFLNGMMVEEKLRYFRADIKRFVPIFGNEMCEDFYLYWSSANTATKRLRMEEDEYWNTYNKLKLWQKKSQQIKS